MTFDPAQSVALLIGLMAAQFLVHAAGWAMTALMQRDPGPPAHFCVFWLGLAVALAFGIAWPAGHALNALSDLALVFALLAVHRGLRLFFRQSPPDRLDGALLLLTLALLLASPLLDPGGQLRALWLALLLALQCGLMGWLLWRQAQRASRLLLRAAALAVWAGALVLLLALAARWVSALPQDMRLTIALFFMGGLFNLLQIRLVAGRVFERLFEQTRLDPLTGVANRRGLAMALESAHRRALRAGACYGLLMVDIDHFKRVNDERGHAAGDIVLREVARLLAGAVRLGDTVGRIGGEEFCLLLPRCDPAGALGLAQRLCTAIAERGEVTVSIGVALVDAAQESSDAALQRADAALYRAKAEGRNRVVAG